MGAFETIELALKLRDEATSKLEKQRQVWARLKLAAVAVVAAFAAFIAKGIDFNKQVERATIQFGAFFRNAELAEDHVRSLTDFAARTPFQLPGILQASRMLLTFAADAAFGADTLRIVGDAAAGVSAPIEEVSTWFGRMYTAIQAGRPMGEALQRLQELGLLSGVARTKMEDLSKAGADQEVIMGVLRDEWEKHDGAMERLSETTEGLESTFTDLVAQVAGAVVGILGLDDAYKAVLTTSNELMTNTLAQLNGLKEASDLNAEQASLEAYIDTYEGLEWAGANLDEVRAKLDDLKNQKFWEQFTADQEAAAEAAKPIIEEIVPAWEAAGHKSAEAYEKALAKASKEATETFWDTAEAVTAERAQTSAFGLKLPETRAAIMQAGSDAGLEWSTAFMHGPGGLMQTIPRDMMTLAEDGSWALAGGMGGEQMAAAVEETTGAWARAGGLSGMFTGITGAIGAFAAGGWKGGLTSMLNTAASYLPPGMAQVAQASLAAISAVWSAMKRPSEEEIQARKTFEGMHAIAVEELGGIAEYQDQVATLMADGWDRTLAETVAGFEHWGAEAGIAHDYVVAKYAEYQAAVKAGDSERMAAIEEEVNAWRAAGEEKIRLAEEAAAAAIAAQERVNNSAISGFEKAKQAGETAYSEIMDIRSEYIRAEIAGDEKKMEQLIKNNGAWVTSHGAALDNAVENQLDANREILQDEGEKYARIAAFDAAMALGADATAEERAAAARAAATAATESWDAAMVAVTASDKAAADAMTGETGGAARIEQDLQEKLIEEGTGVLPAVVAALGGVPGDAETMASGVNTALSKIERDIEINISQHTTYSSSGSSGEGGKFGERAAGGPVSGGRSYLIGERGPELFTPRSGGHVTANRDIIDYDRLAAAIAANPPVIAPDQVAAASLRESPAERAWRGWQ